VSAPVIGDDYVLVKKSTLTEFKKSEQKQSDKKMSDEEKKKINDYVVGLGKSFSSFGGRFGRCKARLVYDFSMTPTTSSTMQTVVALAPRQDTSMSNYWAALFSEMKMNSAEVQLDFTEYMSSVGHDVALSPMVWGYHPTTCATTQYYADVSDWKTSKFIGWSTAKPVVRYIVTPAMLKQGWTYGQEATSLLPFFGRWAPTQSTSTGYATPNQGFVHICTQKAMFDTERVIVGRLIMNMEFRGQL